ncbi:kinase-like domain-containing protein [Aspergillus pseudotamarii]|uniref:Kinase-like domain-containing protein n=1 Tax=Aspergillus pseudotamarii TaxID=132259 RepID=A0A5N6T0U5_ASPPS|nr:kinase-like domain-containing protein [Aspergillus pseudotamarii]KAE8139543.1 kinase-like domain-containing protein [Aspergillus pseudotamarii]
MVLSIIRTWFYDIVWPSATQESDQSTNIRKIRLEETPPLETIKAKAGSSSPHAQPSPFSHDPYLGLPVIGNGMTGVVLQMGENRAVKKVKQYQPGDLPDREDVEYMNNINQQTLENEIQVFERLGSHTGIIPYFQTSTYGIELALAQGNLESYLETCPEREDALKIRWMSSLIDTLAHVHSRKVFVDDIALRNILILDEQLKLADFGQSILLPLDIDITSVDENELNVQIEILHLGWVLYSIASWRVHKYYFFSPENPELCWPEPDSFPTVDDVLCGKIIQKCWRGKYASMEHVKEEVHQVLISQ